MRAGTLNRRIVIEQNTPTVNAVNESVASWGTYCERWASFASQSGREFQAAKQVIGEVTHLIEMRYTAGVTAKMRVRTGTRLLDIRSVEDVNDRREVTRLLCVERAA